MKITNNQMTITGKTVALAQHVLSHLFTIHYTTICYLLSAIDCPHRGHP